jgi:hypothetical protein
MKRIKLGFVDDIEVEFIDREQALKGRLWSGLKKAY